MKKIAVAVAALALSLLLASPAPASTQPNQPKQTIQQFFQSLQKNDVDGSLQTLFAGAQLTVEAVNELSTGITKGLSIYGSPRRFDLVSETPEGPVVVKFVYTQSFDARPLVWKFYAYQSTQGWIIIDAQFNDKTDLF
jgi:hypothetical protein